MTEADHLLVTKDGLVHSSSFSGGRDREPMVNRVRAVVELGTVVYSALDYSLPEDEERNLSAGLDNVIELMVEAESEGEEGEDEGIGEETGSSSWTPVLPIPSSISRSRPTTQAKTCPPPGQVLTARRRIPRSRNRLLRLLTS